jgi:hypothetical protein
MDNKNLQITFIQRLNEILPRLNFARLDQSCNSEDTAYAEEVLKKLHDVLVETYGTDYLDNESYEFVALPAIICLV